MIYLIAGLLAFVVSYVLTKYVRNNAPHWGLIDNPEIESERRQHSTPTPLGGGIAISFTIIFLTLFFALRGDLIVEYISATQLWSFMLGIIILAVGGTLDDKYKLPVLAKIMVPIIAASVVVAGGVGVNFITNPFGGVIRLDTIKIALLTWQDQTYYFTLWADLFTVAWLTLLMYTTKLLDGLDGLVTGVTVIGTVILFFLSLSTLVLQFDTALLLVIIGASFMGFLPHNWHPAKIFLGDSGSLIAGFCLGVVAIIAGGKIATTALVLGLPVIDAIWVVLYRVLWKKKSLFSADRQHLHYRLLDAGFSVKQVVLIFCIASLSFGGAALFMETAGKIITLVLLTTLSFLTIGLINYSTHK